MGLFKSPTIEGAGIKKEEDNRRGFIRFFELFKRRYPKLLLTGLITFLFNLPIITGGFGAVGMAKVARIAVRDRHFFTSDYFDAIKRNWLQALIMGIINTCLTAISAYSVYYIYNDRKDIISFIMLSFAIFSLVIITFIKYYTPSILITFNVSLGQLYKNAIILSFAGIKRNFLILILHILAHAVILLPLLIDIYVGFGIAVCLYFLIIPPFKDFAVQYHIYPQMYKYLIKPYMDEHPDEKPETLIELGLIQHDDEVIMQD